MNSSLGGGLWLVRENWRWVSVSGIPRRCRISVQTGCVVGSRNGRATLHMGLHASEKYSKIQAFWGVK